MKIRNGIQHLCSDLCGQTLANLRNPQTWNDVLAGMVRLKRRLVADGVEGAEGLKLHNALWPMIFVAQGEDGVIGLEEAIALTAAAEFEGVKFDGVDTFIAAHLDINANRDTVAEYAELLGNAGLKMGDLVAPVWDFMNGGSAMDPRGRHIYNGHVAKACQIAKWFEELEVRNYGRIRIDTATGTGDFMENPDANLDFIAATIKQACQIADDFGEDLVAEGEICWGGIHGWRWIEKLFAAVDHPRLAFQADQAHVLHLLAGTNCSPDDSLLPAGKDLTSATPDELLEGTRQLVAKLGPWTKSYHVAQNDGGLHDPFAGKDGGDSAHGKTGHHCLFNIENGLVTEDQGVVWLAA